jgi:hypothetical protein
MKQVKQDSNDMSEWVSEWVSKWVSEYVVYNNQPNPLLFPFLY